MGTIKLVQIVSEPENPSQKEFNWKQNSIENRRNSNENKRNFLTDNSELQSVADQRLSKALKINVVN